MSTFRKILFAQLRRIISSGGGGGGTPFIVSGHGSSTRDDFSGQVGFKFTPSVNMTVTQLGLMKLAGNTHTHLVRLYDSSNAILTSDTIDLSTGSADAYNYGVTVSISLTAGQAYYIVASYTSGGGDVWYDSNSAITSTSDGAVNFATFTTTPPPFNNGAAGSFSFANPNFKYTKP